MSTAEAVATSLADERNRVMAAALDHFSERLMAGARADLLSLAKIAFIKSRTASVTPYTVNGRETS